MKKLMLLLIPVITLLISCEPNPEAAFYTSSVNVKVGENVYFTNSSLGASYYDWDFGDGTFSDETDPVHSYKTTGEYIVSLTAFTRHDRSDKAFQTITVIYPTTLVVDVLEYYDEYPVSNASVILYPTYQDWLDETNMVVEGFTNDQGVVIFSDMEPRNYYLDVWEANHNNYTLAGEDLAFITTDVLVENDINFFTAYVDYTGTLKSLGKRDRSLLLDKKGRKITDKKK